MFITIKGTFKNNTWQKCEITDRVKKFRLEMIGSEDSEGGIFYWAVHERNSQVGSLSIRISEKEHKRLKAIINKIG